MKWKDYLTDPTYIAKRIGLTSRAVWYWIEGNHVPERHFKPLENILNDLGHEITTKDMRILNEK